MSHLQIHRDPRAFMTACRRAAAKAVFATLALCLGTPALAADAAPRVFRIGQLGINRPIAGVASGQLPAEMAKLGYVEGRNIQFEVRHGGGDPARLPEAAAELVKLKVDVIYAVTIPAAMAAKAATTEIPIVGWGMHGAVQAGLVSSLRRPGGNITGVETLAPEIDPKRIQLLKQILPKLDRLAVIFDATDQGTPGHLKAIADAQKSLGLSTSNLPVSKATEFDTVFTTAAGKPLGAVLTLTSNLTFNAWHRIRDFAMAQRLPTLCEFRFMAQSGCLLSYGPTFDEITQRSAAQIDKILRGAAPGDLPMEQPTRFELVINLKTAKALGITVPQELLLRADEVIE
jgi:putative ABC transport system substrate-binding protein